MKTTLNLALAGLAAAMMVGAAPASAQGKGAMNFDRMDADGDGFITRAEIDASAAERFARADTNGDGGLDADEIRAAREARRKARAERVFARLDVNGDGLLQAEEVARRGNGRFFDRADADSDGRISKAEAEAMRAKRRSRAAGAD
ncbi:MAG: hypothetical protein AAF761_09580 [Pseudomonadota bacterium]